MSDWRTPLLVIKKQQQKPTHIPAVWQDAFTHFTHYRQDMHDKMNTSPNPVALLSAKKPPFVFVLISIYFTYFTFVFLILFICIFMYILDFGTLHRGLYSQGYLLSISVLPDHNININLTSKRMKTVFMAPATCLCSFMSLVIMNMFKSFLAHCIIPCVIIFNTVLMFLLSNSRK